MEGITIPQGTRKSPTNKELSTQNISIADIISLKNETR